MPIEYQNIEIEISQNISGCWEVRLLESPINRPRERFVFEDQLPALHQQVGALQKILLEGGSDQERHDQAVALGKALYAMLLPGEVGRTFEKSLTLLDEYRNRSDRGLRLRLSFGGGKGYRADLVNLPWELLCHPETETFIADQPHTPLVRYIDLSRQEKPIKAKPPLKVLAVLASPDHPKLHPVNIDHHRKILKDAARTAKWLDLHFAKPTLEGLYEKLDKHRQEGAPFHVLHFLGHGMFCGGHGMLCFEHDDRSLHVVRGSDLARQLESMSELRLVVLATCKGAKMMDAEGQNPFHGVASALVATRVPAVVGMQFSVSEGAAGDFTSTFYTTLGSSRCIDVDEAMAEGRRKILRADTGSLEWASPVLFLRAPDGHLLDLEEAGPPPAKKIAVFNIEDDHGIEDLDVAEQVDLTEWFEVNKRRAHIKDPNLWNGAVLDELKRVFNNSHLTTDVPYHVVFAAPISVAFAAGRLLEANSGHEIVAVSQRSRRGTEAWTFDEPIPPEAAQWMAEAEAQAVVPKDFPLASDSHEVAVVVSIAQPVLPALGHYLASNPNAPRVGRVIHAVLGKVGQTSIENGAHAAQLADQLAQRIHSALSAGERARIHLFMAVPNAFSFIMGRCSKSLPEVQLYEYDFTGGETGSYEPSILLG